MGEEFLYCDIDDTHHAHNGRGVKFVSKYPEENLKFSEFISRIEKKNGNSREFCVPTHISVEVKFPESAFIVKNSLKESYKGSLAGVRDELYRDLESEDSKPDVTGNNRIVSSFSNLVKGNFKEYLDDINIYIKYKTNEDGCPVDRCTKAEEAGKSLPSNEEEGSIADQLRQHWNIIVEGVAGSGKSHMLQELRASGAYGSKGSRIEVVVFHPSTSYEEFVSGIRPNFMKNEESPDDFVTQEGIFIEQCNRAAANPGKKFLLFIDEINRANTARVFGDLMLVIEDSKRVDFSKIDGDTQGESSENSAERGESDVNPQIIDLSVGQGKDEGEESKKGYRYGALFSAQATVPSDKDNKPTEYVRLQTPIVKNGIEFNKLVVPTNLHVLGTMNTTDRSVGTIDLALRRRFHWVTHHPFTAEELQEAMEENGEDYPEEIASWYENTNTILLNKVGPDARLGHAYFFGKDGDEEAIAEALLNQLKEVAFTFNISQTILDDIGPVHGQKIITRGSGLGARPDIVEETCQG